MSARRRIGRSRDETALSGYRERMGKAELKIEIDAALLEEARAAGVDLAGVTEAAVRRALGQSGIEDRAARWAEENAEAIKAHQERIEKFGVFGEDLRTW